MRIGRYVGDQSDLQSQIGQVRAAAERGAGRMVLPGSAKPSNCVCVIPVDIPEAA